MKISTSHVAAFVAALVAASAPLGAQSSTQGTRPATPNPITRFDPTGSGDTSLFAPLNLPNGNIYRSGDGSPGPKYWDSAPTMTSTARSTPPRKRCAAR